MLVIFFFAWWSRVCIFIMTWICHWILVTILHDQSVLQFFTRSLLFIFGKKESLCRSVTRDQQSKSLSCKSKYYISGTNWSYLCFWTQHEGLKHEEQLLSLLVRDEMVFNVTVLTVSAVSLRRLMEGWHIERPGICWAVMRCITMCVFICVSCSRVYLNHSQACSWDWALTNVDL